MSTDYRNNFRETSFFSAKERMWFEASAGFRMTLKVELESVRRANGDFARGAALRSRLVTTVMGVAAVPPKTTLLVTGVAESQATHIEVRLSDAPGGLDVTDLPEVRPNHGDLGNPTPLLKHLRRMVLGVPFDVRLSFEERDPVTRETDGCPWKLDAILPGRLIRLLGSALTDGKTRHLRLRVHLPEVLRPQDRQGDDVLVGALFHLWGQVSPAARGMIEGIEWTEHSS